MQSFYGLAAMTADLTHAGLMIVWGIGLPLLVWHKYVRLSRSYTYFAIVFVVVSVASQASLGECVLTMVARHLWNASGGFRDDVPFTTIFVNTIAGIRPTSRTAVLIWEAAIVVTSVGSLWSWHATHARRSH